MLIYFCYKAHPEKRCSRQLARELANDVQEGLQVAFAHFITWLEIRDVHQVDHDVSLTDASSTHKTNCMGVNEKQQAKHHILSFRVAGWVFTDALQLQLERFLQRDLE